MTILFNSANVQPSSSSSALGNGDSSKSHLTQQLKKALQVLVKDFDQSDFKDSYQFRERLTEIINLTNNVDQQEKVEEQKLSEIAEQLRLAEDTETLLNQTVTQISQLLDVERVLVYTFDSADKGTVAAESLREGFTPAMGESIAPLCFGLANANHYQRVKVVAIADGQQKELSPYQLQLMERFQVRASLAIPVLLSGKVWGLLVAQQCLRTRQWQDSEIRLLERVSAELGVQLQIAAVKVELQEELNAQKALARVVEKIRQPSFNLDTLFEVATKEVRKLMGIERVTIYKFREDYFGDFVAEAELPGFPKLVGSGWEDPYLQEHQGGMFREDRALVCDDIYQAGLTDCHIEALEFYGVKSCAVVAIFKGKELWGLLSAFQNTSTRHWSESEVQLLRRIAAQIGVALVQAEAFAQVEAKNAQLAKSAALEKASFRIIQRIRQTLNLKTTLRTTTKELRSLLKCDRVVLYQFNPDWSGRFVAEAVVNGWISLMEEQEKIPNLQESISDCQGIRRMTKDSLKSSDDTFLQETQGGSFRARQIVQREDIYQAGFTPCYLEVLEAYQAKAYAIAPVFVGDKLWGLLAAFQNTGPRHWETGELNVLSQVANQLGVAVEQAESFAQVQAKNDQLAKRAELEKASVNLIKRIRQILNLETTLRTTTKDLRSILNCDRVALYQFNPDWSGRFVAEAVGQGWLSLMEQQERLSILKESVSDCQGIQGMAENSSAFSDTYLQENQGGSFRDRELIIRDDIYKAGFTPCYLEVLEEYQAKAYAIAPVFVGDKLWGLLAAFQNTGPRHWEAGEVNLLVLIANQLGVALQQVNYVEELQQKSEQISNLAERGVAAAKLIYKLGQQSPAQLQDSSSLKNLLRLATAETRRFFNTDRVAIYQFNPGWSGDFVVEDVGKDWMPLVGTAPIEGIEDTYLQETQGGRYAKKESLRVDNIYTQGYHDCHIQLLEQFQAKAYMLAPIFNGERLWGLLAAYHNTEPRSWDDNELGLLTQVASQIGVVIQRIEDIQELNLQRQKLAEAAEREKADKERLQQEALSLLRAVEPALQGDLTVKAPLWEDEVGTIADGYNTTLQTLRELVRQVKSSAERVGQTCRNSTIAVSQLSDQAQKQFQDLKQALKQLEQMVELIGEVGINAQQVDRAVLEANQTVQAGDSVMEETVSGIAEIRETVSETAKKLKKLGESSQKIVKVVSLIDNFANQTNLLAINAAIEATRAGEYGQGFAVVADEIRVLAYQSANATRDIERLVQEIRTETQSVTEAMELGIMRVVKGTELVNKTRQSLDEIKSATKQISDRVQQITVSTSTQTKQSQLMTKAMTDVADIANQTSANSVNIASLFEDLLVTSEQLQTSISKFKID